MFANEVPKTASAKRYQNAVCISVLVETSEKKPEKPTSTNAGKNATPKLAVVIESGLKCAKCFLVILILKAYPSADKNIKMAYQ